MPLVEIKPGVFGITLDTIKSNDFPPGGATVRIEPGIQVKRGVDFADVAGRGVDVYRDGHSPKPVGEPTRTQSAGIANMNA